MGIGHAKCSWFLAISIQHLVLFRILGIPAGPVVIQNGGRNNNLKLSSVLDDLNAFSWRSWVYLRVEEGVYGESDCIVVDPDTEELGTDNFTPIKAEELSMSEFLSIQDLREIRKNLMIVKPNYNKEDLYSAVRHYFYSDAFLNG